MWDAFNCIYCHCPVKVAKESFDVVFAFSGDGREHATSVKTNSSCTHSMSSLLFLLTWQHSCQLTRLSLWFCQRGSFHHSTLSTVHVPCMRAVSSLSLCAGLVKYIKAPNIYKGICSKIVLLFFVADWLKPYWLLCDISVHHARGGERSLSERWWSHYVRNIVNSSITYLIVSEQG